MRLQRTLLMACVLCVLAIRPAYADEVQSNEPLVMRLIFEECLGFMLHDRMPFQGLAIRPAPSEVKGEFPALMPQRDQIVELLSPRYAAVWGDDSHNRYCMMRSIGDASPLRGPGLFGVNPAGFLARVTKRASKLGLTDHPSELKLSPYVVPYWSQPRTGHVSGPLRPVMFSLLTNASSDDRKIADVSFVVMSGPPLRKVH